MQDYIDYNRISFGILIEALIVGMVRKGRVMCLVTMVNAWVCNSSLMLVPVFRCALWHGSRDFSLLTGV